MGKTSDMIDNEYEQQMLWIEEILAEAASYGLRWEVQMTAEKNLRDNPEMNIVEAYQYALLDWVK